MVWVHSRQFHAQRDARMTNERRLGGYGLVPRRSAPYRCRAGLLPVCHVSKRVQDAGPVRSAPPGFASGGRADDNHSCCGGTNRRR
jgi:hypothetical protein